MQPSPPWDSVPALLAVGEVVLDVVARALPAPGRRAHVPVRATPGGSPVLAALAAKATGASAAVVGRVGEDWAGRALAAELERAGVRPLLAFDRELPTGVVVSLEGEVGERAVVAGRGAGARLAPEDLPANPASEALLVSGYALLAEGSPSEAAAAALAGVRARWRAVDLASAGLLRARGVDEVRRLVAPADAVFASGDEAEALTGRADPRGAARALAEGRRLGCVTLGAGGAEAVVDGRAVSARPPRTVARELTGAGDVLAGTLLALLVQGIPAGEALERACAAAARSGD